MPTLKKKTAAPKLELQPKLADLEDFDSYKIGPANFATFETYLADYGYFEGFLHTAEGDKTAVETTNPVFWQHTKEFLHVHDAQDFSLSVKLAGLTVYEVETEEGEYECFLVSPGNREYVQLIAYPDIPVKSFIKLDSLASIIGELTLKYPDNLRDILSKLAKLDKLPRQLR